jgi:hypothetical protein
MIAPQTDDRVIAVRRFFERLQQAANLGIAKRDRREICLNGFLSATGLYDLSMVAFWSSHADAGGRNIIQIVVTVGRKLNRLQRKHVKPLLGHTERHVWLHQTDGQKERLIVSIE